MPTLSPRDSSTLEARIAQVASDLRDTLQALVDELPEGGRGPQALGKALAMDKVFASRLLKALRLKDPIAVAYHVPGPEPLRRFCRAARRRGVGDALGAAAEKAVDAFQVLVREQVGDRSALEAILSTWLPEARREFELRRKQAAFRALSQLRGNAAETTLGTVLLHPSETTGMLDVVWLFGLFGLRRLRPGARVKLTTRRLTGGGRDRRPRTLDRRPVDDLRGVRLDQFCDAKPAELEIRHVGETFHYFLSGDDYGVPSTSDLVLAEANLAEIEDRIDVAAGVRPYVFAEVSVPCRSLLFDVLVHEDVYAGTDPTLFLYDTNLEGVASPNDSARDVDRLDLTETMTRLPSDVAQWRVPDVPNYAELLRYTFDQLGWQGERFRAYRCRMDYPLYGTQVVAAFGPDSTG